MQTSVYDRRREWATAVRRNHSLMADAIDREDWAAVARLAEGAGRAARLLVLLEDLCRSLVGPDGVGVLGSPQPQA